MHTCSKISTTSTSFDLIQSSEKMAAANSSNNSQSTLHNQLAQVLRSSPPVSYTTTAGFHVSTVRIGQMSWDGDMALTEYHSRNSAARRAIDELSGLTEPEIRQLLGLPNRPHVNEIDQVRDVLKVVKRRAKALPNGGVPILRLVGRFYACLDRLEGSIMQNGLQD